MLESQLILLTGSDLLQLIILRTVQMNSCSSIGISTSYVLDDQRVGFLVPVGLRIFIFPYRPDRLWDPSSLVSNGYLWPFLRG
jgi:hypothetical protein